MLFDEENALHKDDSNFVFTTEGHILSLHHTHMRPLSAVRRKLRRAENLQCPAYHSLRLGADYGAADGWVYENEDEGLATGILFRPDVDFARVLVGTISTDEEEHFWSAYGTCAVPTNEIYVSHDPLLHSIFCAESSVSSRMTSSYHQTGKLFKRTSAQA